MVKQNRIAFPDVDALTNVICNNRNQKTLRDLTYPESKN